MSQLIDTAFTIVENLTSREGLQDNAQTLTLPLATTTRAELDKVNATAAAANKITVLDNTTEAEQIKTAFWQAVNLQKRANTVIKQIGYYIDCPTVIDVLNECKRLTTQGIDQNDAALVDETLAAWVTLTFSIQNAHAASVKTGHAIPFYSTGLPFAIAEILTRKSSEGRESEIAAYTLLDCIPTLSNPTTKGFDIMKAKVGAMVGTATTKTVFKLYAEKVEIAQLAATAANSILLAQLENLQTVNGLIVEKVEHFNKVAAATLEVKELAKTHNAQAVLLYNALLEKGRAELAKNPNLLLIEDDATSDEVKVILDTYPVFNLTAPYTLTEWRTPHELKLADLTERSILVGETVELYNEMAAIHAILSNDSMADLTYKMRDELRVKLEREEKERTDKIAQDARDAEKEVEFAKLRAQLLAAQAAPATPAPAPAPAPQEEQEIKTHCQTVNEIIAVAIAAIEKLNAGDRDNTTIKALEKAMSAQTKTKESVAEGIAKAQANG